MKNIVIEEVGPRDGFQNVKEYIPTEVKSKIVSGLIGSGLRRIQLTSFVNPKWVPQMRDAAELSRAFLSRYPEVEFFALCPNLKGVERAVEAGYREVAMVLSLSESHNKANLNMTVADSLRQLAQIQERFPDLLLTQDIATAFSCPFEGEMPVEALLGLIGQLVEIGITRINLADTIGAAYPAAVRTRIREIRRHFPEVDLGVHIHDTRNMGMLNTFLAIEEGIARVQSSVCGLGGCPFAPGSAGNISTEDLVYLLQKEGYSTAVDFEKLMECARFTAQSISGNMSGHHIRISPEICLDC